MYNCYCDASYKESEYTGSIGIVVFSEDGSVFLEQSKELGRNIVTNVHAEMLALNEALLMFISIGVKGAIFYIDHKGIVNKINESKYLKSIYREVYKPIMDEISYNLNELEAQLIWVHRKKNKIADKLSK